MATIVRDTTPFTFKLGNVVRPSGKIMLAEEQTSHKPNKRIDVGGSSSIINDGRWVPPDTLTPGTGGGDLLTLRHNKRGDVNFADGHAEPVRPQFGRDPANQLPAL